MNIHEAIIAGVPGTIAISSVMAMAPIPWKVNGWSALSR
jgi:hypothetical protein